MPAYIHVSKDTLYQMYITNNQSVSQIAKILKLGRTTIKRKLKRYDIPVRLVKPPKKSCSHTIINVKGTHSNCFKGIGDMPGSIISKIKYRAEHDNIEFNLTQDYIWNLYQQQNGKCKLSGLPIVFEFRGKNRTYGTASLDRIDSSKGYIPGNVQWLHKTVNKMKWDLSQDDFIKVCRLVVQSSDSSSS